MPSSWISRFRTALQNRGRGASPLGQLPQFGIEQEQEPFVSASPAGGYGPFLDQLRQPMLQRQAQHSSILEGQQELQAQRALAAGSINPVDPTNMFSSALQTLRKRPDISRAAGSYAGMSPRDEVLSRTGNFGTMDIIPTNARTPEEAQSVIQNIVDQAASSPWGRNVLMMTGLPTAIQQISGRQIRPEDLVSTQEKYEAMRRAALAGGSAKASIRKIGKKYVR